MVVMFEDKRFCNENNVKYKIRSISNDMKMKILY